MPPIRRARVVPRGAFFVAPVIPGFIEFKYSQARRARREYRTYQALYFYGSGARAGSITEQCQCGYGESGTAKWPIE